MKNDNAERHTKAGKFKAPDDPIFKDRPCLADACCNPFYDDKEEKGCWTLSFSWDTGACQVSVTDKANSRSLNSTSDAADEALDVMEALLASERRPWRYWGSKKRR